MKSKPFLPAYKYFVSCDTRLLIMKAISVFFFNFQIIPQSVFTCSKLIMKTLEEGVKHVQS